jgi:hypothetical protein
MEKNPIYEVPDCVKESINLRKQIIFSAAELTQLKAENERLKETLRKILMESGGTSPYAGFHDVYQLAKESLTHKEI